MLNAIRQFVKEEDGATAVEYGLMVALIAAIIVTVVESLGGHIKTAFDTVDKKITPAAS